MRKIDRIIVHCTATPPGRDVTAEDVDRWHRERGFSSIGYHYLVRLDGYIEEGRSLNAAGAHCKGYNTSSIGICYVGGIDSRGKSADTRTTAQRAALLKLIKRLKQAFPDATTHGHREFAKKDCPCFDAAAEYRNV